MFSQKKKKFYSGFLRSFADVELMLNLHIFFVWFDCFLQCFRWNLGLYACNILVVPLNTSTSLPFPECFFYVVFLLLLNFLRESHFVAQGSLEVVMIAVCLYTHLYPHTYTSWGTSGSLALDSVTESRLVASAFTCCNASPAFSGDFMGQFFSLLLPLAFLATVCLRSQICTLF